MKNIEQHIDDLRHWASMAALTAEQCSCLTPDQLYGIANLLESLKMEALKVGTDKCEYVTTVMGEVITDALAVQIDDIERRIAEYLKEGNYTIIRQLSEKAEKIEFLRLSICTNHLMQIYDIGSERDQQPSQGKDGGK